MAPPMLIYCAGYGRRYASIAVAHGYAYGCRSDMLPHHPVYFVDINWQKADLDYHKAFVRKHRPAMAVAPDLEWPNLLQPVLRYGLELARWAQRVVFVPKYAGAVAAIPDEPWVVLGYSVPTGYSGAPDAVLQELGCRPVHLLGGSPQAQLALAKILNVVSVDGNAAQRAARFGRCWTQASNGWSRRDQISPGPDAPYRAFARSCAEIRRAWGYHAD
jgi:hypothetical protein